MSDVTYNIGIMYINYPGIFYSLYFVLGLLYYSINLVQSSYPNGSKNSVRSPKSKAHCGKPEIKWAIT